MAVRGSGATPARFNLLRRARRSPGFWDQKRLVIWVFSVREFTEADGWRVMPIGAS
jgi:alginate O-acetyltransferase complex protein AlgJ